MCSVTEYLTCEDSSWFIEWLDRESLFLELKQEYLKPKKTATHNISPGATCIDATKPKAKKKRRRKRTTSQLKHEIQIHQKEAKSTSQKELNKFAKKLIKELKQYNFHILRYDAYTSKSIYLKIDYGAACSIRISDHMGYDHLHYRFNVIAGLQESKTIKHDGYERHFLTMDEFRKLVTLIIAERNVKRMKYSERKYEEIKEKEKARVGKEKRGFFKSCYEV